MPTPLVAWLAACAVLAVAGVAKLRKPDPTMGALRAAGLPSGRMIVRAMAVGEVGLGVAGIVTGSPAVAGAVAAVYLGFAGFVAWALRSGAQVQTCGCFGSPDVPPTAAHLAVNLASAGVAGWMVVADAPSIGAIAGEGGQGVAALLLAVVATFEVVIVLAVAPLLHAARRDLREPATW